MTRTAARMQSLWLGVIVGVLLLAPAPASAVTMTLDGGKPAPPDNSGVIEDGEWSIPEGGGTVTRTDKDGNYTATYMFPLPTTIAAGGQTVTISAKATAAKNSFGFDTRHNASMTVSGDIVAPGGSVNVQALADSSGEASKTTTAEITLTPRAGKATVEVSIQDGPIYTYNYTAKEEDPCAARSRRASAAQSCPAPGAPAVAKVIRISGEVTAEKEDGSSRALKAGDTVGAGVELKTGIDSEVTLQFADGAVMTISEMSWVFISDLLNEGSRQTIRVSVKLGELDATVNPQKAFQSDFKVTVPYATAGVRGTKFSVFYDPVAKVSLLSVREGIVAWDPVAPGLATVTVTAGQEIEGTPTSVSAPAAIGQAGARGGVNRLKARDLVLSRLGRAKKRCKLRAARSRSALGIKPARKGWLVSVKVTGKAKGKSIWRVRGRKVEPKNKVARKIARGCR
ncbi:MAG: FecR family protein [Thermoleophilaceae bacterium]